MKGNKGFILSNEKHKNAFNDYLSSVLFDVCMAQTSLLYKWLNVPCCQKTARAFKVFWKVLMRGVMCSSG